MFRVLLQDRLLSEPRLGMREPAADAVEEPILVGKSYVGTPVPRSPRQGCNVGVSFLGSPPKVAGFTAEKRKATRNPLPFWGFPLRPTQ